MRSVLVKRSRTAEASPRPVPALGSLRTGSRRFTISLGFTEQRKNHARLVSNKRMTHTSGCRTIAAFTLFSVAGASAQEFKIASTVPRGSSDPGTLLQVLPEEFSVPPALGSGFP